MESELDVIRAEAMEKTDALEAEIEELKLELVEKQAQMDALVSSVDSRLNKVLASHGGNAILCFYIGVCF
jgi:hypothetical protein